MRTPVLLLVMGLALQVQPGTGVIEGYVIRAKVEPAFPLVNARLELNTDQGLIARTDSSGRFVFSGLAPGRYRLRVTKDGFVRQEYPRSPMGALGLPIDLAAGQQIRNIVFRLDTAPTISGVIRDGANAVVAGVIVQAMRRGFNSRGNRIFTPIASARTDDRGVYRLYWLDPGEYVIAAAPEPSPDAQPGRSTYGPTYFPGFAEVDSARVVRVDFRDVNGIDFRLVQHILISVFGNTISVTTGSGVPAEITLVPPEESGGVARYQARSAAPDGAFSIPGVVSGSYIFSAKTATEAFAARILVRPPLPRNALQVRADLSPGVDMPGRIALTSDAAIDLRRARVRLAEMELSLPDAEPAAIAQDGRFVIKAVQPGTYALSVSDLPDDLYLNTAIQAGVDVLARLLPVGWGTENFRGPLDIQIRADGGRITGTVFDASDTPSAGAQITLVPEGDLRSRLDRYRTAITGSDGTFTIRGVAPGDYRVFGWDNLEPNAYLNVDYIKSHQDLGIPVRVSPSQSSSVSLRLIQFD